MLHFMSRDKKVLKAIDSVTKDPSAHQAPLGGKRCF